MLVFTTLLPFAAMIFERAYPSRLLRMCPRWSGLLVLGDEYSTITSGDFSSAFVVPQAGVLSIVCNSSIQYEGAMLRFKSPLLH